jgi:hypothetical protein
VGKPASPTELPSPLGLRRVTEGIWQVMPDCVDCEVVGLIWACWDPDPDDRPTFDEILSILKRMNFGILPGVKAVKVISFAGEIEI